MRQQHVHLAAVPGIRVRRGGQLPPAPPGQLVPEIGQLMPETVEQQHRLIDRLQQFSQSLQLRRVDPVRCAVFVVHAPAA